MTKKILVVDDEPGLLKVTLLRLNKTGYEALGATSGEEALALARQKMPDLMLLDVFLPEMNGDEVVRILKRDEKLKCMPIILISAVVESLEATAVECGADGYLPKPFASSDLLGMIGKYLDDEAK